jgi:hypothetical protein
LGLEVVKIKKNDGNFSKISNFNGIFWLWQLIFRPIFPAFFAVAAPENAGKWAFSGIFGINAGKTKHWLREQGMAFILGRIPWDSKMGFALTSPSLYWPTTTASSKLTPLPLRHSVG